MTPTDNFFSHIENLETGSLVLEDPFAIPRRQGSVCRYALHRQDVSVLAPDPHKQGLAAWHGLLPLPLTGDLPETPLLWEEQTDAHSVSLRFPCQLPSQVVRLMLRGHQDPAPGAWSNPFRLEAYKALGLELMARYRNRVPTLILTDRNGELLFGLMLAAQHHFLFHPTTPFRLVLVQSRPYHQLCQAFEGGHPDWADLDETGIRPPNQVPQMLAEALVASLGTAIALDDQEASRGLFKVALEKMRRTGFVDDEDLVILLDPSEDQGSQAV